MSSKKALFINPVSIGDIVISSAVVREWKKKNPDYKVYFATQHGAYEIAAKLCPEVDCVIPLSGNYLHIRGEEYASQLKKEIMNDEFDLVFMLRDENGSVHYNKTKGKEHVVNWFSSQVFERNEIIENKQPSLAVDSEIEKEAFEILKDLSPDNSQKRIGIIPYCGFGVGNRQNLKWSSENFAAVIELISQKIPSKIFVFGTKDDIPIIKRNNVISFVGKDSLPLETVAGILKNLDLVIGLDTGTVHMVAAFDTPLVCIMYPTPIKNWIPNREKNIITFGYKDGLYRITSADNLKPQRVVDASLELLHHDMKSRIEIFYPTPKSTVNGILKRIQKFIKK